MGYAMTKLDLKYVHRKTNKLGKPFFYFRKKGAPSVRLPGEPGTNAFMSAYGHCMEDTPIGANANPHKVKLGSMAALAYAWYQSADFQSLRVESTQKNYRRVVDKFLEAHGEKPIAQLERRHLRDIINARGKTPGAANELLKRIKQLLRFAIDNDWILVDPSIGVRKVRYTATPYHSWTEDEAAKYLEFHKPGTKAHLVFMILSHTGVRKSDLIRLGRGNRRSDTLVVQQKKTDQPVTIPLHYNLTPLLDSITDRLIYVQTDHNKPFTANGFGNWFREQCDLAGLKQCSAHGLRKLVAKRLAEAGCGENTISAILGWKDTRQAALYTKEADREKMARAGIKSLG